MKKLYALIALTIIGNLTVSGQFTFKNNKAKQPGKTIQNNRQQFKQRISTNTTQAVIWSDDFSTPSNWIIDHEPGTDGDWVIGTTGPAGAAAINPIQSATAANGFAKFDSDSICSYNQIGNLTTANPIDLTGYPAVSLEFSQYYARYYDSTYIYVSNDNVNWTKFEVNGNLIVNEFSANNNPAVNPDIVSVNISSVAGNQSTVWIRFQFYSPSTIDILAGCGYSWMIDDVNISELAPIDGAVQPLVFGGEYSMLSLLNTTSFNLSGRVINKGSSDITAGTLVFNVYNAGGQVYSDLANITSNISPGDTSAVLTSVGAYAPADTGLYLIEQICGISGDAYSNNDTVYTYVYVDDSTNARDYTALDASTYINGGFGYGNGGSGIMGQVYHIYQPSQLTSASFYIERPIVGAEISATVHTVTAGLPDSIPIGSSAVYTITANDTIGGNGTFITLPFTSPINVTDADYFLGINQLDTNFLSLGAANNIYTPGKIFYNGGAGWLDVGGVMQAVFIARLNNPSSTLVSVPKVNKSNDFSIYPNPASGSIYISNKGSEGKVVINILNSLGKVVKSGIYHSFTTEKIDLSTFSSGTYTVQIISDKGAFNSKVVLN